MVSNPEPPKRRPESALAPESADAAKIRSAAEHLALAKRLLREADDTAARIVARAEQEAETIRRLARIELDKAMEEAKRIRDQARNDAS